MVEGAALAAQLGTECRACITVAPQILCYQQSFWSNNGYIVSNSEFFARSSQVIPH